MLSAGASYSVACDTVLNMGYLEVLLWCFLTRLIAKEHRANTISSRSLINYGGSVRSDSSREKRHSNVFLPWCVYLMCLFVKYGYSIV